jgi:hypothetical protein
MLIERGVFDCRRSWKRDAVKATAKAAEALMDVAIA